MSAANDALIDAFRNEFADYAKGGLEEFLQKVENEARRLAPVRKVFNENGGRRRAAWRNVYETSAKSKAEAVTKWAATNPVSTSRYVALAATNMQRLKVQKTSSGTYRVKVRSFKQREPYSSESRSAWTKVENTETYHLRQSYSDTEPMVQMPGGGWYVFRDYEKLNYEGRRALSRGAAAIGAGGISSIDTRHGPMTTVAGPDLKSPGRHGEAIANINPRWDVFGKTYRVQLGGALRKSINMEEPVVSGSRISGSVGTDLRYAMYVEFGTAKHGKAQPYLRPALMRYRYLLAKSVGSNIRNKE